MSKDTLWAAAEEAEKALAEAERRLARWYSGIQQEVAGTDTGDAVSPWDYRMAQDEYIVLSDRLLSTETGYLETLLDIAYAAEKASGAWQKVATAPKVSAGKRSRAEEKMKEAEKIGERRKAEFVGAVNAWLAADRVVPAGAREEEGEDGQE